ncbi:hypothetical protein L6452_40741 [Arctium lappa]|uniref:Uncharacterized protein n=1 Tax=Arctium lappa TaxID=4217 RepID=A0ACB8XNB4_ARCLA|nr:hypothetical protein L6452_40741 [Arctium lappa]
MMKEFIIEAQPSIRNLETQVGQLALEMRQRLVGSLPSDIEFPHREVQKPQEGILACVPQPMTSSDTSSTLPYRTKLKLIIQCGIRKSQFVKSVESASLTLRQVTIRKLWSATSEYEQWKDRFLDFIDKHDNGEYKKQSIDEGVMKSITVIVPDDEDDTSDSGDGTETREPKTKKVVVDIFNYSTEQKKRYKADKQARSLLLQSIPNEIYIKIDSYKDTAKKMCYEEFKAKDGESLEDIYDKLVSLLNELAKNKHTRRMKQMKDLNDIPLHEVYETLQQNEEEVEEQREEKKRSEKPVTDFVALMVEKKKEKKDKKKKKKVVVLDSDDSESADSYSDDGESLKQALILLTRSFKKKFYKKYGSNSQRYASGSRNYEHKERVEGKRYEDRRKPKVRNSDYYKNEMLLAKQKEAGKALMAEDDHWMDLNDSEGESDKVTHMCLIGKQVTYDESDDDTLEEVNNLSKSDYLKRMESMMVELQDLQAKLKKEKGVVAKKRQTISDLNKDIARKKIWTKSSEEVERKEDSNRKDTTKMQLLLCYDKLNDSFLTEQPKFLSKDYFQSYSIEEMEAKPVEAKIYVPPLILESKIYELESTLIDERILCSKEFKDFMFPKSSEASHSIYDDDLFDDEVDFLNSEDVFEVGESSSKVDDTVPMSTYYAKVKKQKKKHPQKRTNTDMRYIRSEVKLEWRPKKIEESTKSFSVLDCNRSTVSSTDVVDHIASNKSKLVLPCKTRHMWYLDSGYSKHMTGQKDILSNYIEKFCGNLRFGNDHFSPILGYGDVVQENITIKKSTSDLLELLHMDLWGPMHTQSINGKKYVSVIVDDYSRYTWVKFLRSKDETPDVIISFLKSDQVNMQRTLKLIRTDNGT